MDERVNITNTRSGERIFSLPSALVLSALIYAVTLTYPINIDSAVHAYMAQLFLKGYWPYTQVWENNFPGTMLFVHLPELLLFGKSALGLHVWDMLWQLAGTFFLYRLVEEAFDRRAAWLACLMLAIYYISLDNLMAAQRDGFASVVILASIYWLDRAKSTWSAIGAGLFFGIAVMIRPTNEIFAAVLALRLVLALHASERWWRAIAFLISAQVLIALTVLLYSATGNWTEFYTIVFRFNTEVYSSLMPVGNVAIPFWRYGILLAGLPIGIYAARKDMRWFLFAMWLAAIVTIIPQKRYPYQFHSAFVFAIALSSIGYSSVLGLMGRVRPMLGTLAGILLPLGLLLLYTQGRTQKRVIVSAIRGTLPAGPIRWNYDDSPLSGFRVLDSVASYIHSHTAPDQKTQMVGEFCYPLFQAERVSATRFITFHVLMRRKRDGTLADFQQRWRKELMDTLSATHPAYIIVVDAPEYAREHLNGLLGHEILERDLTALDSLVRTSYHFEQKIGAFTFYRANSGA